VDWGDKRLLGEHAILLGEAPVLAHDGLDNAESFPGFCTLALDVRGEGVVDVKDNSKDLCTVFDRNSDTLLEELRVFCSLFHGVK
jgi:hypothetical protein